MTEKANEVGYKVGTGKVGVRLGIGSGIWDGHEVIPRVCKYERLRYIEPTYVDTFTMNLLDLVFPGGSPQTPGLASLGAASKPHCL